MAWKNVDKYDLVKENGEVRLVVDQEKEILEYLIFVGDQPRFRSASRKKAEIFFETTVIHQAMRELTEPASNSVN